VRPKALRILRHGSLTARRPSQSTMHGQPRATAAHPFWRFWRSGDACVSAVPSSPFEVTAISLLRVSPGGLAVSACFRPGGRRTAGQVGGALCSGTALPSHMQCQPTEPILRRVADCWPVWTTGLQTWPASTVASVAAIALSRSHLGSADTSLAAARYLPCSSSTPPTSRREVKASDRADLSVWQ